jgi:hypothetical protein
MKQKPTTPEGHAGIFRSYDDIPARYRLETYAQHYEDDDTLTTYYEEVYFPRYAPVSEWMETKAERARDSWQNHMTRQDRHHALATPSHVASWCDVLLDTCSPETAYKSYFRRIYNFYDWLKASYKHPHLYNPLQIAAIEYETTYEIWHYRVKIRPSNNE